MTVQALFVDGSGVYPDLIGRTDCWANDEDYERWPWAPSDDARDYQGPDPVVAHPPCQLWVNMAAVNWKRYGRQRPAWYPGGDDGGCFASALASVRKYGGVLEHPADTHAWGAHKLIAPRHEGWDGGPACDGRWQGVCEVWQSAYGHPARKRTWLLYCGKRLPFDLDWTRRPGTHQVGWFDRNKPTVSKREASATPRLFAETLIYLAEWSRGE